MAIIVIAGQVIGGPVANDFITNLENRMLTHLGRGLRGFIRKQEK